LSAKALAKAGLSTVALAKVDGTGSWPPSQNGWHRASRLAASQLPLKTPWRWTASAAYSEQDGTKRQDPV